MKTLLTSQWRSIKRLTLGDLAFLLLLLLVFSIPFQRRIEISTDFIYSLEIFNEYSVLFIYATDLLLILLILIWGANVLLKKRWITLQNNKTTAAMVVLFLFSLIPSVLGSSYPEISWFYYGKIILFMIFLWIVSRETLRDRGPNLILFALMLSGAYQSLIGIVQFFGQRSIGLTFLGESSISPEMTNVAEIVVSGTPYIRAYGTFPHANVFAAFLVASILATMLLIFLYRRKLLQNIQSTIIGLLLLYVQYLSLILTFSRTAWLAGALTIGIFALVIPYFFWKNEASKELRVKFAVFLSLLSVGVLAFIATLFPYIETRFTVQDSNGDQAVTQRELLDDVSRETFNTHPVQGLGLRTFVLSINDYVDSELESWQYQPVHSIYLLILAETGIVGLAGFFLLLQQVTKRSFMRIKELNSTQKTILIFAFLGIMSYLIAGAYDHHPWTMQQSQLTVWLLVGILAGFGIQKSK